MVGNFAEKLFLGQQTGYKRLNCAQAIAEAFRQEYNFLTEDTVKDFKKWATVKHPMASVECFMQPNTYLKKTIVPIKLRNLKSISASLPVRQNARS